MYEGGKGGGGGDDPNYNEEEESRKNEAYLLGKEYVPEGGSKNTGDFAVAATMTGALEKASTSGATIGVGAVDVEGGGTTTSLRIIQQDSLPGDADPGKTSMTSIDDYNNNHHEWNKEFHLRHEDPMFAVHQRRMAQEKDIQKKKRLMERAGLDVHILRRGAELSTSSNNVAE